MTLPRVASGPTVADGSLRADALAAAAAYGISLPEAISAFLKNGPEDAPLSDGPRLARCETRIIALAARSHAAAAGVGEAVGIPAVILSDSIEGAARDIARMHGAMLREIVARNGPFPAAVLLLSGGETTVTLRGSGKGGRNSDFQLALALEIAGLSGVTALAADTVGIDGSEDNAGAFVDGSSASCLRDLGGDPRGILARYDTWTAFGRLGDLFMTGPTGTNVNDFRAILVDQR